MSEALFAPCAEVLKAGKAANGDLDALLDPDSGFASRLTQICRDQLADLEENSITENAVSQGELEALKMESDTWALLQALIPHRKTVNDPYLTPRALLALNPYTPPATLAQATIASSPLLSALVVVREWLCECAPLPAMVSPGATNGYWRFTRHVLLQHMRTGQVGGGIVTEMDPDAVNRDNGDGKALAVDDANYEKALLQALFAHVRAGRNEEAADLCRKAHQPWRAASINGAMVFQWRAIANESREEDAMEEDEGWRGNLRRKLWKTTCTRAALNQTLSPTERALYAALAPSPQTAGPLKAHCRTWADQLWALVCVVCEERLSASMASLAGECFWEGGLESEGAADVSEVIVEDKEEDEWEQEVISALDALGSISVEEGAPADNPYHVSQLYIILDRTDALLEAFAKGLREDSYIALPEYASMTRFFAHLCLFLRMIDIAVPPLATQVILEAYLHVLETAGKRDLIAMYASALGDNAVERYAMFLTSLDLLADEAEREHALKRASDHGLDTHRVAIATAERTIEKAFGILPPLKGPLPSVIGMQPPPSDAENLLVRSIEWTTFSESTYDTALEQACVVLRYFLGHGRVHVAKTFLDKLPPALGSIHQPEELATEYLHYHQFFNVWEALARVVEIRALDEPNMNRDTRTAWINDYKNLLEYARSQVMKLLTTEWLTSDVALGGVERRRRDLMRIRQIYIPELIIRLHSTLTASRNRFPENLKHALAVVNVVADSRYKLYEDFVSQDGRRLGDYLGAVRQAFLAGLEGGGLDPFRVITV
ncbi:nuclear pore protein 84/107 [Amylocystis lapponica]|nr:nuclear pore protein 84/107 [Amylocystis lapponica]